MNEINFRFRLISLYNFQTEFSRQINVVDKNMNEANFRFRRISLCNFQTEFSRQINAVDEKI